MRALARMGFWALLLVLMPLSARAAGPDDILGTWLNEEKDARIEVEKCGERYCGKVVWLQEANYAAGSKDGIPGTPLLDHNNPDPKLRKTPIIGLPIVRDFAFAGDGLWKGGTV